MLPGAIAPDLSSPIGLVDPRRARRTFERVLTTGGILLVAVGVVTVAVWAIFVSPLGFRRFPVDQPDQTFTIHQAGSYVIYLEAPGESQDLLPPSLEVVAAGLGGQRVEIRRLGTPGTVGAPAAYDVLGFEGRGVAVVTVDQAGTFVVHVRANPASEIDLTQERFVPGGTVAIGRAWSRGWPASWWGLALLSGVPVVVGLGLVTVGWRRRGVR
jgi:hypothetical protein